MILRCALILALSLFTITPRAIAAGDESIAAIVNNDAISSSDVAARTKLMIASSGIPDSPETRSRMRSQVLNTLIEEKLMVQAAVENNIVLTQQDIDEGFLNIAKNNNFTPEQFRTILNQQGIQIKTLEDQIRSQISWSRLAQSKLRSQVVVSNFDIQTSINRLKSKAGTTQYLASEIFLPIENPDNEGEALKLAEKLHQEITKNKAPFPAVAAQFSQGSSATRGGDMGWVQGDQLAPEIQSALSSLKEGAVSQPVRAGDGVYILLLRKISEVKEEDIPSEDDIFSRLGTEQLERLARRYLLDLKAKAFIEKRA